MSSEFDGLTSAQREAVMHSGGPLLVVGPPGSGKTHVLQARFRRLVEQGRAPASLLVLTFSPGAADRLRARLEAALTEPYEELAIWTFADLGADLLRRAGGGLMPAEPVGPADRLALMLDHLDELPLRRHDLQGNPAGLLGTFIARFDRLKDDLVTAEAYAERAAGLDDDERGERGREFAGVFAAHERLLSDAGALDYADLVLRARDLLEGSPDARRRTHERFAHVLVDEAQELTRAQMALLALVAPGERLTAAGDDGQAVHRVRGACAQAPYGVRATFPNVTVVDLATSSRVPAPVLAAAKAAASGLPAKVEAQPPLSDPAAPAPGPEGGEVRFWSCANERAQAQGVAADVERLLESGQADPGRVCVLVRSVRREGEAVAVALEERGVPFEVVGAASFFQRSEIRDVLAWLRLLADPADAPAAVRALARPPVELRSIDLARCMQIARRRKLDMVSALVAATESPQIPPEARERILGFLRIHRSSAASLDVTRPDLFVHRLIERLGLRRQQLFAAQADVVERLVNLAKFGELAAAYGRRSPQATPREFARYIAAVAEAGLREEEAVVESVQSAVQVMAMRSAKGLEFDRVYVLGLHSGRMPGSGSDPARMRRLLYTAMTRARRRLVLCWPQVSLDGVSRQPSPFVEQSRVALGAVWEQQEEELFGPAETLHSTFRVMRDELLDTVARTGGRLSELRFDTDLDVSHAVVRYLELLKLSALLQRPDGQSVADALAEVNARLARAVSPEQRDVLQTSALDDLLLDAERGARRRAQTVAAREEPSLDAFLPRRGDGLMLSASDVETYRICPLRYKFARVFRIPQEPTIHQRFGILVHQVLERFHAGSERRSRSELLGLLDQGWRRNGFGDTQPERQLRDKATAALTRYHERQLDEGSEPVWLERSFAFKLGPHLLRGRVDRVDRLPGGGYELIDYKTGRPKTAAQLREDVQLSLYALGAREAWELETARQAYYYVLDDAKVPVERDDVDREWITDTVMEVADGILGQGFEPTPSYAACSTCDFRLVCPAAER